MASHPVNGGNCLISDGQYQYIAFYDGEHRMTVAALNGLGLVAKKMWEHVEDGCEIISITNAQSQKYWQDPKIRAAASSISVL